MRAAIYARYSTDLQSASSIEDQIRLCRECVEKDNGAIVEVYSDHAISGSSIRNRPGMRALLEGAKSGKFDCVIAEALDRLSRDQEDTAAIHKRLRHSDNRHLTYVIAATNFEGPRFPGFGCAASTISASPVPWQRFELAEHHLKL
jgi:site-specific DNA recombinase